MIQLSKRLQAVADLVTVGNIAVDVGTDHGYLPIYRIEQGLSASAIAMDVGKGPLEHARQNVEVHGLGEQISLVLSDGLKSFEPEKHLQNQAPATLILAGMGGGLMISILSFDTRKTDVFSELVLEPQSDVPKVRAYLAEAGWLVTAEDFLEEDGKYYPVMRAEKSGQIPEASEVELTYGPFLLKQKNEDLDRYLVKEEKQLQKILEGLDEARNAERVMEVKRKLELNAQAQMLRKEV